MKSKKLFSVLVVLSMIFTVGVASSLAENIDDPNRALRPIGDRVTVAASGEGDMLMGPLYFADDISKYSTKIVVVNTSPNMAVVAKVVFRSPTISAETLDFMLYLTPNDVWDAEITYNSTTGDTIIKSTDDSCLINLDKPGAFEFATTEKPFVMKFLKDKLHMRTIEYVDANGKIAYASSYDVNNFGHIEIIGAKAYTVITNAFNVAAPVSKADLYGCYHRDEVIYPFPKNYKVAVFSDDKDAARDVPNVLAAKITLTNGSLKQRGELAMTALQNFSVGPVPLTAKLETGLDSDNNSVAEIEAAIAKPWLDIPFDFTTDGVQNIMLTVTFPTKYQSNFALVTYRYAAYDMKENLFDGVISGLGGPAITPEVYMDFLKRLLSSAMTSGFTKGYVKLVLGNTVNGLNKLKDQTVLAVGTPALGTTLTFTNDNDLMWTPSFAPAARVNYNGVQTRQ